jgi:TRAP-type C4-dicarboxylate transport system permease small subunit
MGNRVWGCHHPDPESVGRELKGEEEMEKITAAFKKLQKANSVLIGAALLAMIAVVFLQTFCRFVIFRSLTWSEELSRYLFVAIIALGINLATTKHMFVRIEIIDGYLKGKALLVLNVIRRAVAMYVSLVFVYSGYRLIQIGGYQVSPAMAIPMSFLYGIIFLGFVMNALAVAVDIYEEFADVKEDL